MMNYANMFVLVLDDKMIIRFCNWSLATALGFENEFEPIGSCWLDFIQDHERELISSVHNSVMMDQEIARQFQEYANNIVTLNGEILDVKWFNAQINHDYHWTFSFGLLVQPADQVSEESVRSYYRDIIQKDRTMILSLRDMIVKGSKTVESCEPKF